MSIGRNDPCPCNSNKKFKKCCLITQEQTQANNLKAYQDRLAQYNLEWEEWFKNDQAVGQKNMAEATVNFPDSPNPLHDQIVLDEIENKA